MKLQTLFAIGWLIGAGVQEALASVVFDQWEGMSYAVNPGIDPPDPHGAAGPNGVIQTVNLNIAYWDKSGASIWGPVPLASFWPGVGEQTYNYDITDPRAIYDRASGRFYVVMQELAVYQDPFSGIFTRTGYVHVAVSKSSNPTTSGGGDWYFYRLDITQLRGGVNYFPDYPGLGVDAQAVYVTYNMNSGQAQIVILNKAAVNSGTETYSRIFPPETSSAFTLQPATVLGTSSPGNVAYFAETPGQFTNSVRIWALSDPLGSPTLTSALVAVPSHGGPFPGNAPQAGTTNTIWTLGPQTQGNAFWHNGGIWFCHTAGSEKTLVYYYKVNLNSFPSGTPTLGESGSIDGGPGVWTYQPSIGGNSRGDVCIVYCQSSTNTYPTIMFTARAAGAASFEAPTVIKASPGYYTGSRWGDYGSVSSDPIDESFWITHEWAKSTNSFDWSTWWANASLTTNPAIRFVSASLTGGNGNQSVEPNECNDLAVLLRNNGNTTATNVFATLSTSTPGVTVVQPYSTFPNIAPGAQGVNATAFRVSTAASYVCGTPVNLTLIVAYTGRTNAIAFSLPANSLDYVITQSEGAAIVPGTTDVGNHAYNAVTLIALPFSYSLYGKAFSSATVSSDGWLRFEGFNNSYPFCLPDSSFTNEIFAHAASMRTDMPGSGIFTSISGNVPNRIFNIEWRTTYIGNGAPANFELRLYEGQQRFDVVYGNGTASVLVGVQNTASKYTLFGCNSGALSNGLHLTFQIPCDGGGECLPLILSPTLNGTNFAFSFATVSGKTYFAQYENSVTDSVWQALSPVAGDGTLKTIAVPISAPQRFYRLLVQ